jgi:hypothetical protein
MTGNIIKLKSNILESISTETCCCVTHYELQYDTESILSVAVTFCFLVPQTEIKIEDGAE